MLFSPNDNIFFTVKPYGLKYMNPENGMMD